MTDGLCPWHSYPVVCLDCGIEELEHITLPPPTYHYEDHQVAGKTMRTPVMDGHFYLPAHRVRGSLHACEA